MEFPWKLRKPLRPAQRKERVAWSSMLSFQQLVLLSWELPCQVSIPHDKLFYSYLFWSNINPSIQGGRSPLVCKTVYERWQMQLERLFEATRQQRSITLSPHLKTSLVLTLTFVYLCCLCSFVLMSFFQPNQLFHKKWIHENPCSRPINRTVTIDLSSRLSSSRQPQFGHACLPNLKLQRSGLRPARPLSRQSRKQLQEFH